MKKKPITTDPSPLHAASNEGPKRAAALCTVSLKLCKRGKLEEELYGKNSPQILATRREIDKILKEIGLAFHAM